MAKQMQRHAIYPKQRLYFNWWHNHKAKHKWKCAMWLWAEDMHKHHHALCKRLLHNCNPSEGWNIRVLHMVRIRNDIRDVKNRKPDDRAASVIFNATHRKNRRHGIIAAAREVLNTSRPLGNRSRLMLRQRVQRSACTVRAVRNTWLFQTETKVIADNCTTVY